MAGSEFVAALAGAIVGGGASLAGAVAVNRRELIRSHRVRLHDGLLPALQQAIESEQTPLVEETLRSVRRAAVLSGRGMVELVDDVARAHLKHDLVRSEAPEPTLDPETGRYPEMPEALAERLDVTSGELWDAMQALADRVEAKIL